MRYWKQTTEEKKMKPSVFPLKKFPTEEDDTPSRGETITWHQGALLFKICDFQQSDFTRASFQMISYKAVKDMMQFSE